MAASSVFASGEGFFVITIRRNDNQCRYRRYREDMRYLRKDTQKSEEALNDFQQAVRDETARIAGEVNGTLTEQVCPRLWSRVRCLPRTKSSTKNLTDSE